MPLPLNLDSVPPMKVTSPKSKLVVSSLNVKVMTAVCDGLKLMVLLLMAIVGDVVLRTN